MSDSTFFKLTRVLDRPKFDKYILASKRNEFLQDLAELVQFVDVTTQIEACRDPKDNQYLEVAVSAKAECIVTGDDDLAVERPVCKKLSKLWGPLQIIPHLLLDHP